MIGAIPTWALFAVVLLFLFAVPLLTVIHAALAVARKNGPVSRFLLLGLLPSLYSVFLLGMPNVNGTRFSVLRDYWPPLIEWSWVDGLVRETWYFWPAFLACLVFGAEIGRRGNVPRPLIRLTIAATYLGAFGCGYLMLESLGRS
jgi:hypothetical protein